MSIVSTSLDERIAEAILRAYDDAEITPPTTLGGQSIVPLQQLLAGQCMKHSEHPSLKRREAAAFLNQRLPYEVEIAGDPEDELSGYLFANHAGGWVLVDHRDPITRRRYTVAHELGHYLLHAQPRLEAGDTEFSEVQPKTTNTTSDEDAFGQGGEVQLVTRDDNLERGVAAWETEANQFAAALLMPADLCRALAEKFGPRCGHRRAVLAKRLASELLVSQQAMDYRLDTLGIGLERERERTQ